MISSSSRPRRTTTTTATLTSTQGAISIRAGIFPTTLFYTRNGEGNRLFRNEGNFRFTDVTKEAGINETGLTLGVAWGDYDNDNDLDMYVANDFGRDALLKKQRQRYFFRRVERGERFRPGLRDEFDVG